MADTMKTVGVWAFIIGVILAIIVGVLTSSMSAYMGLISTIMIVLGLIVGILNITDKEITSFVIAAIGLAIGSITIANLGPVLGGTIGEMVRTAFTVFGVFVAGAVFIPALKTVFKLAKD